MKIMFTFLLMFFQAYLPFASQNMDYAGSSPVGILKSKNRCYTNTFKKLIITRNRVVAKQSRCDGVYNRTGDLSVICFGKEERRRERGMAFSNKKSRHERYKVRDDVVEMTEPDKASLVSLFFNYMSVLLRKTWTMQVQALSEFHSKIKRPSLTVF